LILSTVFFLSLSSALAQGKLDKKITIKVHQKSLKTVLMEIGRKGDFYFSYNTNIINGDSLVNVYAEHKTVRQVLDKLLGGNYEYVESGKYVILLQRATALPVKVFTISGYVIDGDTKQKIGNVSVYESNQLVSTLTDTSGYFRLRLKDRSSHAVIVVSKQSYRDTLLLVEAGYDQQFTFSIEQARVTELSPFVVNHRSVEKTWLGRWFISSREVIQSMNLIDFFANKPIQFSLTPGLGTHGRMAAQVVNKFSLNVIGGYTAGINGFEIAGVFNIDKNDVKYVQYAGTFNTVGGKVTGMQIAGGYNLDLDSLHGFQAAGAGNNVKGGLQGVQLSGVFNRVEKKIMGVQATGVYNQDLDTIKGVQLSGLYNYVQNGVTGVQAAGGINRVKGRTDGMQVAGIGNISKKEMHGVQISSLFNYTRNLKGVQIGLVNIADTSSGYMLGLINIVKSGYHTLTISSNEVLPINIAYKTGSRRLYSILLAGFDVGANEKAYSVGFGIGSDLPVSGRLSVATELTMQNFYLGSWDHTPALYRLQSCLQVHLAKKLSLFAGPAFSLYNSDHVLPVSGYKTTMPRTSSFGWTAGINFF
jgi:hypothetical protein